MICPVCGCQQREADQCIQCYTSMLPDEDTGGESGISLESREIMPPLEEGPLKEEVAPNEEILQRKEVLSRPPLPRPVEKKTTPPLEPSFTQVKPRKKVLKSKTAPKVHPLAPEKKEISSRVLPSRPTREDPPRQVTERQDVIRQEKTHTILVTTTQRIEGKRITSYFGLISADIIIDLGGSLSSRSEQSGKAVNAHYRGELKKGMLMVLRDLRGEAALLGANAVIATSFNFQKIDIQALLVSAVGTAVHMEDRT